MHGADPRDMLDAFVAERRQVDAGKQCFSRSKQHRSYRQMQFVDEAGAQELSNRRHAAAETNACCLPRIGPRTRSGCRLAATSTCTSA